MAYQVSDFKRAIKHALGKSPDVVLVDQLDIINRAKERIATEHPWSWLKRKFSLTATLGNSNLSAVPSDFNGIAVMHEGTVGDGMSMKAEVVPLFARTPFKSTSTYRYHVEWTPDSDATGPAATVFVFPPAIKNGTFEGLYLRTLPELVNDTDYVDMPLVFRALMMRLVRAIALVEDGDPDGASEMQDYEAWVAALKDRDPTTLSNTAEDDKQPPSAVTSGR